MKSIIAAILVLACFNSMVQGNNRDTRTTTSLKYVKDHGALTSCVQPSSRIMSFCNISYTVPSYTIEATTKHINYIIDYMNTNSGTYTPQCLINIKHIVCSGLLPKCSSSTTLTYASTTQACLSISSCPTGLFTAIGRNAASFCVLSGRQFQLNSCINSGISTFNGAYCKSFPNVTVPAWELPNLQRQAGSIITQRVGYALLGVSSDCINKWTHFLCNAVMSCNAAKTRVINFGLSKQECNAAINCLPSVVRTPTAAQLDCNIYADENSASPLSIHLGLIAVISFLVAIMNS